MPRMRHGTVASLEQVRAVREEIRKLNESINVPFALAVVPDLSRFDYLFPKLQKSPSNLLHESPETVENLKRLGQTMLDPSRDTALNSKIPAIYTYFGQFIDHDITLEAVSSELASITDPNLAPLPLDQIEDKIKNTRSATLDLDSVYGDPAPRVGMKMAVGKVSPSIAGRPPGKDDFNDLPRRPRSTTDPKRDREALIGDARNDENLIVAQLHLAFLRAHNALVQQGRTFDEARTLLRQHYQWLVIEDFLMRIADAEVVKRVRDGGNQVYDPFADPFFMPLEFTVAAYRFGHSMVRAVYNQNVIFEDATLEQLFTFTALTGGLGPGLGDDTLPENWIIQWENFVEVGGHKNAARRIDTMLVEPLFRLRNEVGQPLPDEARLAVRNLLRGYLLRMPTGQAVAESLRLQALTPDDIEGAAANEEQRVILRDSCFSNSTPLWFYILAEAAHSRSGHLGPVGSTLIAEVLIGLVRRSEDSILSVDSWSPTLGQTPGQFTLTDLLRLAGVLN